MQIAIIIFALELAFYNHYGTQRENLTARKIKIWW